MGDDKIIVVKFYNATQEDWRNPNIYIDTDPSESSDDEETSSVGSSTCNSLEPLSTLSSRENYDNDPLTRLSALNVKSDSSFESNSPPSPRYGLPKVYQDMFSSKTNTEFISPNSREPSDPESDEKERKLAARFARFPSRKYVRGNRRSLSTKAKNESEKRNTSV